MLNLSLKTKLNILGLKLRELQILTLVDTDKAYNNFRLHFFNILQEMFS